VARLFGIDVSHFQSPAAPAGVPWKQLRLKSSFVIVRASYGAWADPNAVAHIRAARAEGFTVGLYHFFVSTQAIAAQLDVFCAQAVKCGVGNGDIVPALDLEDDGKNVLSKAMEPLARQACDTLSSEFGSAMPYITQAGWHALGAPAWLLELPLWVAHYTNAPKPATPGNVPAAIWQNRVGLYAPGAPFNVKEAYLPNALDQDVCDVALPLATMSPSHPSVLPPAGPPPPPHPELWQQRLDALTVAAAEGLDLSHNDESAEGMGL
jgi:hypothetical protein